jgi:hypothetical protein
MSSFGTSLTIARRLVQKPNRLAWTSPLVQHVAPQACRGRAFVISCLGKVLKSEMLRRSQFSQACRTLIIPERTRRTYKSAIRYNILLCQL